MSAASKTKPVACVTGGASGIGQAIATQLVDRGYQVIVADIAPGNSSSDIVRVATMSPMSNPGST